MLFMQIQLGTLKHILKKVTEGVLNNIIPVCLFFTGLGYWTRGNPEMCLLATRGKPKRISKSVKQLVVDRRREHSRKPDRIRDDIVQLCGDVSRIELFARQKTEGWDSWGNEV